MNITYLLGAGASANTFPVVTKIQKALQEQLDIFQQNEFPDQIQAKKVLDYKEISTQYRTDLIWLIKETEKHASIDTFAKKLWLTNDPEYNRAKRAISTFFVTYQLINGIDKRYDFFWASILKKNANLQLEFPKKVNILSWNYDTMVELSLANFLKKETTFSEIQNQLSSSYEYQPGKLHHIKLNGTAGQVYRQRDGGFYMNFKPNAIDQKKPFLKGCLKRGLDHFNQSHSSDIKDSLIFSWEDHPQSILSRNNAIQICRETQILVVIGYSFPTFNRDFDRKMFKELRRSCQIIYLQTDPLNGQSVKQRINALSDDSVQVDLRTDDINEFFIPFQFDY